MGNVNNEIARIEQAKEDIETAIETCGVDVPDTALIDTYASYINQIPSAVFSQFNLAKQGGADQYIESIEQTNGTISVNVGGVATTTKAGLMSAEDKIRLNLLKAQPIPLIEGPDTDTRQKWTGTYDGITEYSHGMSIWYVPYQSPILTTTLNINNLGEKSVKVAGGGKVLSGYPNLLVYDSISNSWFFCDYDTDTHIKNIPIYNSVNRDEGYIYYYTDLSANATIFASNPGYIMLCNPIAIDLENITQIAIGRSSTSQYRKPVVFTSHTEALGKGYHIAYYDGETVYINTDGVIPGKIEKAKIAETVEWNEVEGDNEDVSIGESSVTNSLYLYTHDLTNVSKKPSEYKNQYLTAWFSKTNMPLTQTCSGINISSSATNVNWQLCSLASNTYNSAYDRLWFRSGIGESWNPWLPVAFINDLSAFKVKQEPVEDPTADGVSTTFIDTISLDEHGKITVTKKAIPNGSNITINTGYGLTGGPITTEGTIAIDVETFKLPTHAEWDALSVGEGGGSLGTVSYVNLVMPDSFIVSGNPITTAGEFTVTLNTNNYIPTTNDVNKWNSYKSHVQSDWVAEEGSDAYIKNKPIIPNVGAGTLTIKVNNSEVAQFSANATENETVNINTIQSIPIASETDLGGIKLGYTESGTNLAVKLDNEKAHVTLSKNAIVSALGFEPGTGSGSGEGSVTSITPGIGLTGTNDDSAITSSGTINLKQADSSELGGIKIGYNQNDKNYPVVLDTDNKAYVNVPYPDAKYCNDAVLKTADFPAYNSTEITAIDASLVNDVNIENYFKALCKYVYAKYKTEQASNSAITLLGQARPGSTGTLLMSMYTNHPCTNDPTMPKYVSGNFVNLGGQSFIFTNYDDLWTWKQLGSGTVTSITPGTGLTRTDDTGNTQVDTAVTTSGTINLKLASTNELGGIKVGYTTDLGAKNYQVLVDESGNAYVNVPWQSGASVDTKNTAGATNSEEDLFIIGSTEQSDNPQTYSNVNIKISENAIKASGGFYQESDERLKDFHDDILVDLEQLSNLPKKKFTWKSDDRKKINIGTSAQELQKLYPELVKEDSNGTLSVSYDKLSIIALRAIDELYVLVKTLQEENNQLKELIRNTIK